MRKVSVGAILVADMTETPAADKAALGADEAKTAYSVSAPVSIAVLGDPIVGRALTLLLCGPRYDAKFVPTSSVGEPGPLDGAQLVLLAPTPGLSHRRRRALVMSIVSGSAAAGVPILELIGSPVGAQDGDAAVGSGRVVPWPCFLQELERHIEAALLADQGTD
jgi:hypothetical protein